MPDFSKDEGMETRTHSLCLFGVPGITGNRRCDNCSGPARTPLYHQKRCPLDSVEPNIFILAAAGRKSEMDFKSFSASSSKQDLADVELPVKLADMSLAAGSCVDGTARGKLSRSMSEPDIRKPNKDMFINHVDVGDKRKADSMDQPESPSRNDLAGAYSHKAAHVEHAEADQRTNSNEEVCLLAPIDGSSEVEKRLRNEEQELFLDLNPGSEPLVGCWGIPADVPASVSSLLIHRPLDTPEDHRSGRASELGIGIPGFLVDTVGRKGGIHPCHEGIYNVNETEEFSLMGMEIIGTDALNH